MRPKVSERPASHLLHGLRFFCNPSGYTKSGAGVIIFFVGRTYTESNSISESYHEELFIITWSSKHGLLLLLVCVVRWASSLQAMRTPIPIFWPVSTKHLPLPHNGHNHKKVAFKNLGVEYLLISKTFTTALFMRKTLSKMCLTLWKGQSKAALPWQPSLASSALGSNLAS